jgi:carboxymethylenebutenolidase
MYHFGERDKHITAEDVAKIKAAHPEGIYHLYPADHGFNCDQRGSYDAPSAALARERTLAFFAQYVAGDKPKS